MIECSWYDTEKEIQRRNSKVQCDGNVGVILSCVICTPNPKMHNPGGPDDGLYSKALKNTLVRGAPDLKE